MTPSEIRRYLIKEQRWDKRIVLALSKEELKKIYEHYKNE